MCVDMCDSVAMLLLLNDYRQPRELVELVGRYC